MRFPWLFAILVIALVVSVALAWWWSRRRETTHVEYVANTRSLTRTPTFRAARTRARAATVAMGVGLGVTGISLAVLAAAPVDRQVENEVLSSRDIVLCLDASGSMLPYDGQILTTFNKMVESFEGERLSLHMWSAQTVVRFPLTDDYDLISQSLQEGVSIINSGYLGEQGDYVLVTKGLSDYLDGVEAPDGSMASSLIGDGLASCVLGFDNRDQERSRTIILATDNEVVGDQIYSLSEAVEFAVGQNVEIIALYPGNGSTEATLSTEGRELKAVVEAAGGDFYFADDAAAIEGIIELIESTNRTELEGESSVVETDLPETPLKWACIGLVVLLAGAAWRRT